MVNRNYIYILTTLLVILIIIRVKMNLNNLQNRDNKQDLYQLINDYRKNDKIIFIVGSPGSGTTLMRTIMDVSPKMNCDHETKLIPNILYMRMNLIKLLPSNHKSYETYLKDSDNAFRLFIVKVIEKGDPSYEILCAKDPGTIYHIEYLAKLFENIRIIYMIRDGRGSSLSTINRENRDMEKSIFHDLINKWNDVNSKAYVDCKKIGADKCLMVKYEDLVTDSEKTIRKVLEFTDIEFSQDFLHHEQANDIDFSNDRSKLKINTEKLNSWDGKIDYDKKKLENLEMFKKFGYKI